MRKSTLFKRNSTYWPLIQQFVVAIQTENFPETDADLQVVADSLTRSLKLEVVNKFIHPFTPYGTTLVYVLSQSHLAIHTWPERKTLHVDLVTCSPLAQEEVEKAIKQIFPPDVSFFEWM